MNPFAIYFPQFYPIPANDRAWGIGFTDWALLANANMLNLWQRRAPKAGYYDGSSRITHHRQIAEAKCSGLGGFALYHYWFYTQQVLGAFENTLLSGTSSESSFPWFLIWATESWSKRWVGNSQVLIELPSNPTRTQIESHCDHLAICFSHPDYVRWRHKPLFVFYNLAHFVRPESIVVAYRSALFARGVDVAIGHFVKRPSDFSYCSFVDLSYLFEPRLFFSSISKSRGLLASKLLVAFEKISSRQLREAALVVVDKLFCKRGLSISDRKFLYYLVSSARSEYLSAIPHPYQEVVSPGWNNTPRYRGNFTELRPLAPAAFANIIENSLSKSDLPVLINAWNEWSEGAAVEACAYYGTRYLDAISSVLNSPSLS
jgi:hypothetical protein